MSDQKDILHKTIGNLGNAIKNFSSSRGTMAKRIDQLESMVAELYSAINKQNQTIKNLITTNSSLALSIKHLSVRLKSLESPAIKFSKSDPDPVN